MQFIVIGGNESGNLEFIGGFPDVNMAKSAESEVHGLVWTMILSSSPYRSLEEWREDAIARGQVLPDPEEHFKAHTRDRDEVGDGLSDEETCDNCPSSLDDGEGYDGLCGNCADLKEEIRLNRSTPEFERDLRMSVEDMEPDLGPEGDA